MPMDSTSSAPAASIRQDYLLTDALNMRNISVGFPPTWWSPLFCSLCFYAYCIIQRTISDFTVIVAYFLQRCMQLLLRKWISDHKTRWACWCNPITPLCVSIYFILSFCVICFSCILNTVDAACHNLALPVVYHFNLDCNFNYSFCLHIDEFFQ